MLRDARQVKEGAGLLLASLISSRKIESLPVACVEYVMELLLLPLAHLRAAAGKAITDCLVGASVEGAEGRAEEVGAGQRLVDRLEVHYRQAIPSPRTCVSCSRD